MKLNTLQIGLLSSIFLHRSLGFEAIKSLLDEHEYKMSSDMGIIVKLIFKKKLTPSEKKKETQAKAIIKDYIAWEKNLDKLAAEREKRLKLEVDQTQEEFRQAELNLRHYYNIYPPLVNSGRSDT